MCEMTDQEKLAAYERMYADLLAERDKVLADMDKLRAAGKTGALRTSSCWPRN